MERATGTEVYGCGSPQSTDITLNIQTTTGSNFSISLNGKNTVEYLKKLVSKKLRVGKDRICLLHRERQLRDGTLEENGLLDGSRVILLPSVETGLLSQRQENSVMQALESLNETQVNDFLTGKSPLNLTMRLGDHMMLIQLQLSTLHSNPLPSSSRSLKTSTPTKGSSSSVRTPKRETKNSTSLQSTPEKISHQESDCPADNCTDKTKDQEKSKTVFKKTELEILKKAINWYQQIADKKNNEKAESTDKDESMDTSNCTISDMSDSSLETDQSPIKSLSNLVSSPLDPTVSECKEALVNTVKSTLIEMLSKNKILQGYPSTSKSTTEKPCQQPLPSLTPESSFSDDSDNFTDQSSFLAESTIDEYPMEHLFNSAVDKGLFEEQEESMMDREISHLATTSHGTQEAGAGTLPSFQSISEPLKNKRFQYLLHKTSKFKHPIGQNKQKAFMQSVVNKHKKRMQIRQDNTAQPSTSRTEPYITNSRKLILQPSKGGDEPMASTSTQVFKSPESPKKADCKIIGPPDTKDLIEASKNLTQKLKKLSREVLTNKVDLRSTEETVRSKIGPGAMIESMKHHGKGVYSGTFSGTLNPALQDRFGRPKKDISTIIHILNDLLCASPPISLSQKDSKHSCTTTSSEELTKCLGCSQPACSYGKCDGHLPSTSSSTLNEIPCTCGVDLPACHCLPVVACEACADQTTPENPCNKCNTAKSLALDNSKTKCKLEQLRLVMQQKKQRREARKLKTMPYSTPSKTLGAPEVPASISEEIESIA